MSISCGHCKNSHATVEDVRRCSRSNRNSAMSTELEQIAEHGRAQVEPYPHEQKVAQAAERLRKPSETERHLEEALHATGRLQFQREYEIVGYFVDFYFPGTRIVVELDSSHHEGREVHDARRDEILKANGYEVHRFGYSEVMNETNKVVQELLRLVGPVQKSRRHKKRNLPKKSQHEIRSETRNAERLQKEADQDREYAEKRKRQAAASRTKPKYRFRCQGCSHEFWATSKPWPCCNACNTNRLVRCVCSEEQCNEVFKKRRVATRCHACARREKDVRNSLRGGLAEDWKRGKHSRGT